MPRLEAFSIAGLDLFFNSLDHLPPHFHARRAGEWEIRVFFLGCAETLTFELKWSVETRGRWRGPGVPAAYRHAILAQVQRHRAALLREWEQKVGQVLQAGRE